MPQLEDQTPPASTAVIVVIGAVVDNTGIDVIVGFPGPVCALPGEPPNSSVKLPAPFDQSSTNIIKTSPAVTIGEATEEAHGKSFPN